MPEPDVGLWRFTLFRQAIQERSESQISQHQTRQFAVAGHFIGLVINRN